jgi:RNA polymerase sigma-54 factor
MVQQLYPSLELSPKLALRPELRLTQQMLVTIKLLSLARLELEDVIRQELMDNPALEESFEAVSSKERADAGGEGFDFGGLSLYPGGRKGVRTQSGDGDQDMEDRFRREDSLFDEVLRQVRLAFDDAQSRAIGSHIAGNLNRDGYLACAVEEIAAACGTAPGQVSRVLTVMQGFEPAGVCACDLKECLLLQLKRLEERQHLAEEIIRDHLRLLERGDLQVLCRATGTTMETVQAAVRTIRGLEPKPGRPFYGEISRHVVPDAYAFRKGERVEIRLNDKGLPRVTVSRRFGELLKRNGAVTKADRAYLKDKVKFARYFTQAVEQRRAALLTVLELVLTRQKEFFDRGPGSIGPLMLKDVAGVVGYSESTVSRTVSGKYVQTPHGVFSLKHFFSGALKHGEEGSVSSRSVQEKIRGIIAGEDPRIPLSDGRVRAMLVGSGIEIARRTVAKYREQLRIQPACRRRQWQ